jgi:nicotinamidase-related amidase
MGVKEKFFLDRNQAALVIIDVQEKLCRAMDDKILHRLTANINVLQETAGELGIPVVVTEQYVKGLGETLSAISEKLSAPAMEKMTFSCCGDSAFLEKIQALKRRQVVVVGMETHVCVLQTVLELRRCHEPSQGELVCRPGRRKSRRSGDHLH